MCYRKNGLLYPAHKLGPLTKHHLKPTSVGGKNTEHNVSYIPQKLHEAWHLLFSNNQPPRIASYITEHFLDKDYVMMAIPADLVDDVTKALNKNNY